MNALLVIAHGSRNPHSDLEIRDLVSKVSSQTDEYDAVDIAYLELIQPDIPATVRKLVERGATSIVALPYFLAKGNHVSADIPEIIEQVRQEHPQIDIDLVPHIGINPQMPQFITEHLRAHAGA